MLADAIADAVPRLTLLQPVLLAIALSAAASAYPAVGAAAAGASWAGAAMQFALANYFNLCGNICFLF